MDKEIVVIGGGISGLTTALTLQLLGYDTTIYTDNTTETISSKQSHPEFASLFPSASIIPHSVYSNRLSELFPPSQQLFYELRKFGFPGVTSHRHFELFESSVNKPDFLKWMPDVRLIDNIDTESIPRRNKTVELDGWSFECLFADWPIYLPALWDFYQASGGSVMLKRLKPADIAELPTSIVINCSGTGARFLFEDPGEHLLLRGHLLFSPKAPLLKNNSGVIISYNYTPAKSVYADSEGNACDIYCYPRKDGWILGGSRQAGTINKQKNWSGAEVTPPFYKKTDRKFPAQIIDLNKSIIEKSLNTSFPDPNDMKLIVGYRYIRSRNNGLRLEKESFAGKTVFHNYGHGGAGVTLSWGCALDIAQKLQGDSDLREKLVYAIQQALE